MRIFRIPIILLFSASLCWATDALKFGFVKIRRHRSPNNRVLVEKYGDLKFDDAGRKLTFRSDEGDDDVAINYDDIEKVILEVTSRMRGGPIAYLGMPGLIASVQNIHNYWFYLEYKQSDHNEPILLEVPKGSSEKVIAKARELLGARIIAADFPEKSEEIDPKTLPNIKSKHTVKVDKKNHPLPEIKSDKATVIVVCPAVEAWETGRGNQFKLHANDKVVAVNLAGTYSFAYLDPGKYKLVSQSVNASGFEMELEAGKEYYFRQDTFAGGIKWETGLSRNSPELVMYEVNGAYYSDWERK